MTSLCRFIGVLAVTAAIFIPASARAAEMRTDCAQSAQDADNLGRLTSEIAQVGSRVDSTGSELASHMQGQAGAQVNSRLQRTSEDIRAALRELQNALESAHSSCSQYSAPREQVLRPMNMGKLRGGEQRWDFGAVEAGLSEIRADQARLGALTEEVRVARGDFGEPRNRAVAQLMEAQRSMTQLNQAIAEAAQAMHNNERCVSGMFSDDTKCKSRTLL
jgi:predicted  nucleic acid-binding Zn-ribbon protein